jgi:type IV/VI secretion system ImpK/VasF family protein
MSGEMLSTSITSRLVQYGQQQMPQGYYRSRLFVIPYASNPLLAAAGPLFSLLERLCVSPSLPAIQILRDNIDHEVKAFHSRLHAANYSSELIGLARYLLSATIDELLGKSYLRLYGQQVAFQAFTPPTSDHSQPQQRFFDVIKHLKERPSQYLDLLELAYFCLIAGFEGEQHGRADGRQNLDNLIDELYTMIQEHRVNKPLQMFTEPGLIKALPPSRRKYYLAIAIAVGLLIGSFFASESLLDQKAKSLLFGADPFSTVSD